jgi:hypothetical protein
MATYSKLFVIWRAPSAAGTRHVIGTLARTEQGFAFEYLAQQATDAAAQSGFREIFGFPVAEQVFESRYLFPVFQQRIPSPARADFKRMMADWGVVHVDDSMEVLGRSGGVLATDRLELAEFRTDDDELTIPLEFRIAGLQKRPGASAKLKIGDTLKLEREPGNIADPLATLVARVDGETVGYVPRQYAVLIARQLDECVTISATTVRKILLPEAIGAWVVRAARQ